MKTSSFTILIIIAILISACKPNSEGNPDYDFIYETIVTEEPVNLEEINSLYDDYNLALPYEAFREGIYFSTNRNSAGEHFDFIYKALDISYHSNEDILNISHVTSSNTNDRYDFLIAEISSEYDEFGPYPYWGQSDYEYFFYANNEAGNFDIKYASIKKGDLTEYQVNQSFTSLNSEYDELYPSISDDIIHFCSNRENEIFDIYTAPFNDNDINPTVVNQSTSTEERNDILSSNGNDKCPYVSDNLIVFTSDREGGYGGYDLYYSKKVNGNWTEAQNFGAKINSEFDEYRPITIQFFEFNETMLMFSSNREGGKGGFDLYAVRTRI